ncbi:MAG: divalent-cation tolerance protein CutA [Deltaproteobacteria bacterium]|nr:divalent-cation tolerance protein CutA [Deltaproteobacteria bacterium]
MNSMRVCLTTFQKTKEAKTLASRMLGERLAACVQMVPKITSMYEWDGAIQTDEECLMIIKTTADKIEGLKSFIAKYHTYEVPELICLKVEDGLPAYLNWVSTTVRGA